MDLIVIFEVIEILKAGSYFEHDQPVLFAFSWTQNCAELLMQES